MPLFYIKNNVVNVVGSFGVFNKNDLSYVMIPLSFVSFISVIVLFVNLLPGCFSRVNGVFMLLFIMVAGTLLGFLVMFVLKIIGYFVFKVHIKMSKKSVEIAYYIFLILYKKENYSFRELYIKPIKQESPAIDGGIALIPSKEYTDYIVGYSLLIDSLTDYHHDLFSLSETDCRKFKDKLELESIIFKEYRLYE